LVAISLTYQFFLGVDIPVQQVPWELDPRVRA
jgi:hypothetical protein